MKKTHANVKLDTDGVSDTPALKVRYGFGKKKRFKEGLTLDLAKPGDRLVIKGYNGGIKFKMRLITMGLRVGDTIEVITNSGRDQVVIAVQSSRYVLGRGMASKILVEQIQS